jgi:hypothetical protein
MTSYRLFLAFSSVLFVSSAAYAQFRAGVQGSVLDPTGATVPDAAITLHNAETGREARVRSNESGYYVFAGLPPGRYTVTAEKTGFKRLTLENVVVEAEQVRGLNLSLETGEIAQSITVTEQAEGVQTENANISRGFSAEQLHALPQINRNPYEVIRLAPGVFGDGGRSGIGNSVQLPNTTGPGGSNSAVFQTEVQVPISANGQRVSSNNFQLDGVSVNSLNWGGAAVITPNQEAVKEMRVTANAYSAEYGRNSGAQIEVISQNGTNDFHGSALFKLNEPGLNAYNPYGGIEAPPVRVNNKFRQFAGSVGGPILREKLFFFASYEGLRNKSTSFDTNFVETAQFRQSVIDSRPGSIAAQIMSEPGIAPRIGASLTVPCPQGFAAGNCQQVSGGLDIGSPGARAGAYTGLSGGGLDGIPDIQFAQLALPGRLRGDQYNGRVDLNLRSNALAFSLFVTSRNETGSYSGGRSRPLADLTTKPLNLASTVTDTWTIAPTLLNQLRFNFTRFSFDGVASSSETNFGIPLIEIESLPFDRIRFGAERSESTPAIFAQNTFEFRDILNWVAGNHALKFGVEIRREQDNNNLAGGARPLYTFDGLFNFANDATKFEAINADPNTGAPADAQRYFRTGVYGAYIQDDWKVRPGLTLNAGVRYEYFSPLTDKRDRISNLVFGPNLLQDARVVQQNRLYEPDRNNFAPRLGFAWNPTSMNRLVVRGGFGLYYNRIPNVLFSNTRGNPPSFARYTVCCGSADSPNAGGKIVYSLGATREPFSFPVNPALATGIDPATGTPKDSVEIWGAPRDMPNAYVYVWSMDVQYALPHNMVATLGYQASSGHKLIRIVNQEFLYPENPRFFGVYFPQPDVNSNFNALNARLTHRFARGLQVDAGYRFSKSIDTLSYEGPGAETNQTYPQDLRSERGPSDFDATHYFIASGAWEIPFRRSQEGLVGRLLGGFELSGILTARSGFPWTPKTGQPVTTPGGPSLSPTRPVEYFGGALMDHSNDAFIRPGGNFPGGGRQYFDISRPGAPGIGRNSFRGPRYFGVDLSVAKRVRLWSEATKLDLRMNLYNAFNQLNLAPFGFVSQSTFIENDTFFGRADRGLAGRVVELQARFEF